MNDNKSGNNFFSGFLLGALVGGALVFLVGTKKGKRLLEVISEEGMENISNILEKADKSVNLDEVLEEDEKSSLEEPSADKKLITREENPIVETKPKIRRFFRGISRHVN